MTTTIEMIAHCMFHQTPADQRERCQICRRELTEAAGKRYCAHCLVQTPSADCPICVGRSRS